MSPEYSQYWRIAIGSAPSPTAYIYEINFIPVYLSYVIDI